MIEENLKYFTFEKTLVAAKTDVKVFRADNETDNYAPFKNLTILNSGLADIKVYINQGQHFRLVPAGTIFNLEDEQIQSLQFENKSATIAAEFTYTLDNKLTQKEILKAILEVRR